MRSAAFVLLVYIVVWIVFWLRAWFAFGPKNEVALARMNIESTRAYRGPKRILHFVAVTFYSYAIWPVRSLIVALGLAAALVEWVI